MYRLLLFTDTVITENSGIFLKRQFKRYFRCTEPQILSIINLYIKNKQNNFQEKVADNVDL